MNLSRFDLTGKVAIVTGTSRGLGQYFGRALARAGADLVITSRTAETLWPFQQEIEASRAARRAHCRESSAVRHEISPPF